MVGLRWLALTALLPLLGSYARAWPGVRALPFAARLPVYFAAGLFTIAVEMFVLSALGLRWSFLLLLPLPIAAVVAVWRAHPRTAGLPARPNAIIALAILAIAIFASMVFSAAVTSGDYVLFWGVKGQRFGAERMLDTAFMLHPNHYMTPDYPPLLPLYYAWTMLGGDVAMDWWGGLAAAPLFLLLSAMAFWGFGKHAQSMTIDAVTALFASMFALLYIRNAVAGNAEPMLLFFATVAIGALIAQRDDELDVVASIALAGAAMTKVEGGVLALLIVGCTWIARRGSVKQRVTAGAKLAIAPCLALATWNAFSYARGLTDMYRRRGAMNVDFLAPAASAMGKELSLGLWYAPWIAALIVVLLGTRVRSALPWVAVAVGYILFLVAVAMRPDTNLQWTAGRTLLTPLLALTFAGVAASRTAEP
jgi:hypothetical protein